MQRRARLARLNCLEGLGIDDGRMLPWPGSPVVVKFAEIVPVAQDVGERTIGQMHAADRIACCEGSDPGSDVSPLQFSVNLPLVRLLPFSRLPDRGFELLSGVSNSGLCRRTRRRPRKLKNRRQRARARSDPQGPNDPAVRPKLHAALRQTHGATSPLVWAPLRAADTTSKASPVAASRAEPPARRAGGRSGSVVPCWWSY